jgi:hypothetical protein
MNRESIPVVFDHRLMAASPPGTKNKRGRSVVEDDDLPMIDRLRANADLVVSIANKQLGKEIGFDEEGVRWLDGYIQRQHEHGDPANIDGLVSTLGSYLGECIIQSYGGTWGEVDGSWCVRFDDKNGTYPLAKVRKHLENGAEDSVLSFFTLIPIVFKMQRKR